jgi:xanthine/uracil/vitamin C permease (AzgA family)
MKDNNENGFRQPWQYALIMVFLSAALFLMAAVINTGTEAAPDPLHLPYEVARAQAVSPS